MRAWLFVLVFSSVARAAPPTVAVMPFRDLSGQKNAVGEAIRETVTADLKNVSGLLVIERAQIDRILSEQNLQANRADLDPLSTVKIGKLLGATMIVTGAYQRQDASVRLTARFVNVETGEVTGTAKVDGNASEFLTLQDRITVELLRSAGLQRHTAQFAKRARPKLKSLRSVELYGDALNEADDTKRAELLRVALREEPQFEYAVRDLDALEKRLAVLERAQKVAEANKLDAARRAVAAETDPAKKNQLEGQLAMQLMVAHRWFELRTMARSTTTGTDVAAFYLVQADLILHDWDGVLHDGESFMSRFAASPYFASVKNFVEQAITHKRRIEEGRDKVAKALTEIVGAQRWNLCRFGWAYRSNHQHVEAERFLRACMEVGSEPRARVLSSLINEDVELHAWAQARRDITDLQQADPNEYRQQKTAFEMLVPADAP